MKTIIMQNQKSSRWATTLLAGVVGVLTSAVVANATKTVTTPIAAFISYSLAPGTNSAAITPVTNKSVPITGCFIDQGGVGQVTLLHFAGLEAWNGGSNHSTTAGDTSTGGTRILYIDDAHFVDIRTATKDTILIHNGHPDSTRAGNVTLIG